MLAWNPIKKGKRKRQTTANVLMSMKSTSFPLYAFFSLLAITRRAMICRRITMSGFVISTSTSGLFTWLAKPLPVTAKSYLKRNHSCWHQSCSSVGSHADVSSLGDILSPTWSSMWEPSQSLSPSPYPISPPCNMGNMWYWTPFSYILCHKGRGKTISAPNLKRQGSPWVYNNNGLQQHKSAHWRQQSKTSCGDALMPS